MGADECYLIGGDSGGPSFTVVGGAPALVGIHWFNEWTNPQTNLIASGDSFASYYIDQINAAMSGEVVLMALVGWLGTIIGPVVGAFIIITMQNYLAATGEFVLVIQGVIFVVIVMAFRKGLVGEIADRWKAWRSAD